MLRHQMDSMMFLKNEETFMRDHLLGNFGLLGIDSWIELWLIMSPFSFASLS